MQEENLNVNVKINGQFCLRKFKKMEVRPYRDKRYKEGFKLIAVDKKTGQFTQGRGVSYPDPKTKEYYDGRKIKRRKKNEKGRH